MGTKSEADRKLDCKNFGSGVQLLVKIEPKNYWVWMMLLGLFGVVGCSRLMPDTKTPERPVPSIRPMEVSVTDVTVYDQSTLEGRYAYLEQDAKTQKIWLAGEGDYAQSVGRAVLLRKEGTLEVVAAVELPELKVGYLYQAWLVRQKSPFSYFPLGVLKKHTDGRYWLEFTGLGEQMGFDQLLISAEMVEDEDWETVLMRGAVDAEY